MSRGDKEEWMVGPIQVAALVSAIAALTYGAGWLVMMASEMGFSPFSDVPRSFILAAGLQFLVWLVLSQAGLHFTAAFLSGRLPLQAREGERLLWRPWEPYAQVDGEADAPGWHAAARTSLNLRVAAVGLVLGGAMGVFLLGDVGLVSGAAMGAIVGAVLGAVLRGPAPLVVGLVLAVPLALWVHDQAGMLLADLDRVAEESVLATEGLNTTVGLGALLAPPLSAAVGALEAAMIAAALGCVFGAACERHPVAALRRAFGTGLALVLPPLLVLWIIPYLLLAAMSPLEIAFWPGALAEAWWTFLPCQALAALLGWTAYRYARSRSIDLLAAPVLGVLAAGLAVSAFSWLLFPVLKAEWGGGAPRYAQLYLAVDTAREIGCDVAGATDQTVRVPVALLGWSGETYHTARVRPRPSSILPPRARLELSANDVRAVHSSAITFIEGRVRYRIAAGGPVRRGLEILVPVTPALAREFARPRGGDTAVMWLAAEDRLWIAPWPRVQAASPPEPDTDADGAEWVSFRISAPADLHPDRIILAPTNSDMYAGEMVRDTD